MWLTTSVFLITIFWHQVNAKNFCHPNNVCTKYSSYYAKALSSNCFCVADVDKDPDVVAQNAIQTSEFHEITTEDGYIIGVFRLRRDNPKGVVILHHPVTVSSRIWMNYGNKSSAIEFWRKGYDVWLPNNRGVQYSRKHTTFAENDPKYWDFDFHEMGLYDHKPVIDFIYEQTKQKIYFVGHSMSTTTILIYSAYYPEEAKNKLELVFGTAPITSFKYLRSPGKIVAYVMKPLSVVFSLFRVHSLFNWKAWYLRLGQAIITPIPLKRLFAYILAFFCGWTPKQFDPVFINLIVISGLGEIPVKIWYHFAQVALASEGRFQLYDYGKKTNLLKYGIEEPPLYPLEKITVPIYLMYSYGDSCSTTKDNRILYSKLQNETKIYGKYEFGGLNHVDYHTGKDRFTLVYNKIMETIDTIQLNKFEQNVLE